MQIFNDIWDACSSTKFYAYKVPQQSIPTTIGYFFQLGFIFAVITTVIFTLIAGPYLSKFEYQDFVSEVLAVYPKGLSISMVYNGHDSRLKLNKPLPVRVKSPPMLWGYRKANKKSPETEEEAVWKYIMKRVGNKLDKDNLPDLVVFAPLQKEYADWEQVEDWSPICQLHNSLFVTIEIGVVVCSHVFDKHPLDIADLDVLSNPSQLINDLTGTHQPLFIHFGKSEAFKIDKTAVRKYFAELDTKYHLSNIFKTKAITFIFAAIIFVFINGSFLLQWMPIVLVTSICMAIVMRIMSILQLTCPIPFVESIKMSAFALTPAILYYSIMPAGILGFLWACVWFLYVAIKLPQYYNSVESWMQWWNSLTPMQQRQYYQRHYPEYYRYYQQQAQNDIPNADENAPLQ